jgi:hypothetical protein
MSIRRGFVGLVVLAMVAAGASAEVWPGAAPCAGTLQACVDGVASGATISIATNTPILETVDVVDRSLTLAPQAGFSPSFAGPGSVTFTTPTTASSLTISSLTFDHADLVARNGAGNLSLRVSDSTFSALSRDAIRVTSDSTAATVLIEVTRSQFAIDNTPGNEGSALQVSAMQLSGELFLSVTDSVMSQNEGDSNGSVSIYESTMPEAFVTFRGNTVHRSGSNAGVFLRKDEPGDWTVLVENNLFAGSANSQGPALNLIGTDDSGTYSFSVVDNTIVQGNRGIVASSVGALEGLVSNNVVAHFSQDGLFVSGAPDNVTNRNNLFFDAITAEVLGAGSIQADPRFVGAADFRLRGDSPARNAGANADVPAAVTTDLEGQARILEGTVDIGAYEVLASVIEVPTLSEVGLGVMGVLIGLAAVRLLRG